MLCAVHMHGAHGAFLWMSAAPCSSYSALDIHICWNVPSEAKIEPPAAHHIACLSAGVRCLSAEVKLWQSQPLLPFQS